LSKISGNDNQGLDFDQGAHYKKPNHAIVINDGSSDKTHDILAGVQQDWPTLQVIINPDLGYDISRAHERVYSANNPIPIHTSVGLC